MKNTLVSFIYAGGLFVGMLLLLEFGRRLGCLRRKRDPEGARAGLGAVEGAVFALMGLLIAFTFSGAASRFDNRRELIIEEANAIGTAWLRVDLLPPHIQPPLRDLFRRYLDHRLAAYEKLPDLQASRAELALANETQGLMWNIAVGACRDLPGPLASQLIVALNEMFDLASKRTAAAYVHPPMIVFIMLGGLTLVSALLGGYAMAESRDRSWTHILSFAAIIAITTYVILDMEFPRLGMIRVDAADKILVELRQSMN